MRSKTMQRRQLIGAAATAGSVTIAPALLTGCAAAPKSEPAATVATLPEGASAHVTAVAPTGAYRGCVLDGTGVRRWLGIPFIKNPYEPVRRYLKPEPYGAHEGVMDCLKHGSIPLQPNPDKNVEKKMVGGDGPLCLNIWAPKAGENLPVMVWVPGGGSISCAQNDERFDGTNFARDGVVLVTLAYRVNVDGFLKLRGGDSGNGNRDILEGLRWVKANIAAFGGDPDKITAFGQSAGGTHPPRRRYRLSVHEGTAGRCRHPEPVSRRTVAGCRPGRGSRKARLRRHRLRTHPRSHAEDTQ